ncbi:hypothetical protein MASR2M79_06490 [Aminivibrio sp.]
MTVEAAAKASGQNRKAMAEQDKKDIDFLNLEKDVRLHSQRAGNGAFRSSPARIH